MATRAATLPLIGILLAALAARGMSGVVGLVATPELAYLALLLWVFVVGAGVFGVDTWIGFLLARSREQRETAPREVVLAHGSST